MPKPVPDWVKTQLLVEEEEERTEEKRRARADEAVENIHTFWGQADFLLPRDSLRRVLADPHSSGPYVIASTGKPTTQLREPYRYHTTTAEHWCDPPSARWRVGSGVQCVEPWV